MWFRGPLLSGKKSAPGKLLSAEQRSVFTYDKVIATLWSTLSCLRQCREKVFYWYRIWDVDSGILMSICWVDLLFVIQCDNYDDDTVAIIEWCLLGLGSAGVHLPEFVHALFLPCPGHKISLTEQQTWQSTTLCKILANLLTYRTIITYLRKDFEAIMTGE